MPADEQTPVSIRDSRPEDFDEIVFLLQQLWPGREINQAALNESFLKSFEHSGHIIRVACYEDRLLGLCSLSIRNNLKMEGNLGNIDELIVDERMRGRQIGKLLLEDAERISREKGCKILGLESSFHREDAHRFYEREGYSKMGYYLAKKI